MGRSGETAPDLGERLDVDSGISGECLRTGVSLRCDDASRDFHVDAEVCRQMGLQSIAVVPLRGQHGRVGVLEAFSTESYAFTEDKMALLERLAGLAEAAWARGAVTEAQSAATGLVQPVELERGRKPGRDHRRCHLTQVETSPEPVAPVAAEVPLAQVREVFAGAQIKDAIARKKWRLVAIAAAVVMGLALLSVYGWRAWYEASVASRSGNAASAKVVPSVTANPTAGAGFPGTPDVVFQQREQANCLPRMPQQMPPQLRSPMKSFDGNRRQRNRLTTAPQAQRPHLLPRRMRTFRWSLHPVPRRLISGRLLRQRPRYPS